MLTFGLSYDVKPERQQEFEAISEAAVKAMQGMKGHRETRLYQDVFRRNSYMIYSDWDTREDFVAFLKSPEFAAAQTAGRDMLEARPRHHVYERANFEM
ncbi:MAG TPA: antibiotic biosynthesis monooxygenase [Chloroflexota bacterium]|jgi:chlorite dismutase